MRKPSNRMTANYSWHQSHNDFGEDFGHDRGSTKVGDAFNITEYSHRVGYTIAYKSPYGSITAIYYTVKAKNGKTFKFMSRALHVYYKSAKLIAESTNYSPHIHTEYYKGHLNNSTIISSNYKKNNYKTHSQMEKIVNDFINANKGSTSTPTPKPKPVEPSKPKQPAKPKKGTVLMGYAWGEPSVKWKYIWKTSVEKSNGIVYGHAKVGDKNIVYKHFVNNTHIYKVINTTTNGFLTETVLRVKSA